MKILLAGEYSRLHNSLKEGLEKLGQEVRLVSGGDFFKKFPSDFPVGARLLTRPGLRWFRQGIYRLMRTDLARWETAVRLLSIGDKLRGYDIVQLINIYPFETPLLFEKHILQKLFDRNDKAFLLACGDDYVTNRHYLDGKIRYSVLTPLKENPHLKKQYAYSLKYLRPSFRQLQAFVEENVAGIIPTDLDYAVPYAGHPKNAGMIPNPVNTDKIAYRFPPVKDKIVVFHGINTWNIHKKGNRYFSDALLKIRKRFKDKVQIVETKDLPYDEYVRQRRRAHIVLDMVWSFDQGYNALESMAEGKVVFTGAEREFYDYYRLDEPVCINALPDAGYLFEQMAELIENPRKLIRISENARRFIEKEHHYLRIAGRYMEQWQKKNP